MSTKDNLIYLSTGAFQSSTLSTVIQLCSDLNYYNLELSSGLTWTGSIFHEIETMLKKFNLLVHNYFPPPQNPFVLNLAAKKKENLNRTLNHCYHAIDLCSKVKSPFYSVHSGFAFDVEPNCLGNNLLDSYRYPLDEAKDIFVNSLRKICEYGSTKGVKILIENNVLSPSNLIERKNQLLLGVTSEDLIEILELVNIKNIGLLIDVGHLKVSANALKFDKINFLNNVRKNILAFHLSDNNGYSDTNEMFNEESWFYKEVSNYPEIYKIIETYNLDILKLKNLLNVVKKI